jgi:spermidine synthase
LTVPLLVSVFVIATCGLVYELLAGTIASYLLGDSVTQFSTIIGAYLFSMGVGSYLAKYVTRGLVARFIQVEILVGLLGGASSTILFFAFQEIAAFRVVLYTLVGIIGALVGMEIPLLLRILKDQLQFHDLVSKVLSLDYLGALVASIVFPLWLVPKVGLVRASLIFGIANVLVALWACRLFRDILPSAKFLAAEAIGALVLLGIGFAAADRITDLSEAHLFSDEVIYSKTTPYQRIVMTRDRDDVRLYLNGHLQFSSFDEYRYHEVLVHPGLASVAKPDRVLVLGGGDGLAIREILRDPRVGTITLVDLDPGMTSLFRDHPTISQLNGLSLRHPKVTIVNADAFIWLKEAPDRYDFIVVDFPDPSNFSLGKLYTTTFYTELRKHLAEGGAAVVQSTSPLFARQSFWCIATTMRSSGFTVTPCHVYVPSFGEWGFMLATHGPFTLPASYPAGLKFLNPSTAATLFDFPDDMKPVPAEINRLNNQVLVHYYDAEWRKLAP